MAAARTPRLYRACGKNEDKYCELLAPNGYGRSYAPFRAESNALVTVPRIGSAVDPDLQSVFLAGVHIA